MKDLFLFYLLIINIIGFILMYIDKVKAIKHQWRISESTLMLISIIGGSLGSYLGMRIFRHKTKHPKFYVGVPLLLMLDIIAVYYMFFEF